MSHSVKQLNLPDNSPSAPRRMRWNLTQSSSDQPLLLFTHIPFRTIRMLILPPSVWWSYESFLTIRVDPLLINTFFEPHIINHNTSIKQTSCQGSSLSRCWPPCHSLIRPQPPTEGLYHPSKSWAGNSYRVCLYVELTWLQCCIPAPRGEWHETVAHNACWDVNKTKGQDGHQQHLH